MTTEQINEVFNTMRVELGLSTDVQLAKYLDITPVSLWRWRQGQIDTTKMRLLSYIWTQIQRSDLVPV